MRQLEDVGGRYKYPPTQRQTRELSALASSSKKKRLSDLERRGLVHNAIHSLFAHLKSDNRLDKYFSAVSCFAVITSFTDKIELRKTSTITSQLMQLIYANRTAQLHEIRAMLNGDPSLTFLEYGILSWVPFCVLMVC
jgi:hypothetical protein